MTGRIDQPSIYSERVPVPNLLKILNVESLRELMDLRLVDGPYWWSFIWFREGGFLRAKIFSKSWLKEENYEPPIHLRSLNQSRRLKTRSWTNFYYLFSFLIRCFSINRVLNLVFWVRNYYYYSSFWLWRLILCNFRKLLIFRFYLKIMFCNSSCTSGFFILIT